MTQLEAATTRGSVEANPLLFRLLPAAAAIGMAAGIVLGFSTFAPSRATGGQSALPPEMPAIGFIVGASLPAALTDVRHPSDKMRTGLSPGERTGAFGFLEFDWNSLDGVPGFDSWLLVADSSAS
jgi:hypothetical protein